MILGWPEAPDNCDHCGHVHCLKCDDWQQMEKTEDWVNKKPSDDTKLLNPSNNGYKKGDESASKAK